MRGIIKLLRMAGAGPNTRVVPQPYYHMTAIRHHLDLRPRPSAEPLRFLGAEASESWCQLLTSPWALGKLFVIQAQNERLVDQAMVASLFVLQQKGRRLVPLEADVKLDGGDTFYAYHLEPNCVESIWTLLRHGHCILVGLPQAHERALLANAGLDASASVWGGELSVDVVGGGPLGLGRVFRGEAVAGDWTAGYGRY